MGNRAAEEACLNRAIELALKQRGWTKKFAKSLQAGLQDGLKKVDKDRPDFVVLCPPMENGKKALIGIEHFRVDAHVIQKKTNAVASTAVVEQRRVDEFYDEHRDRVLKTHQAPQKTLDGLAELLKNQVDVEQKATYSNFVASFEYGLEKHIKHVDAGSIVLLKNYKAYYDGYDEDGKHHDGYEELIAKLQDKFPLGQPIVGEQNKKDFIALFGAILRMSCLPRVICRTTKAAILTFIMKCDLQNQIRKLSMTT